jgi:hypothetical protein
VRSEFVETITKKVEQLLRATRHIATFKHSIRDVTLRRARSNKKAMCKIIFSVRKIVDDIGTKPSIADVLFGDLKDCNARTNSQFNLYAVSVPYRLDC